MTQSSTISRFGDYSRINGGGFAVGRMMRVAASIASLMMLLGCAVGRIEDVPSSSDLDKRAHLSTRDLSVPPELSSPSDAPQPVARTTDDGEPAIASDVMTEDESQAGALPKTARAVIERPTADLAAVKSVWIARIAEGGIDAESGYGGYCSGQLPRAPAPNVRIPVACSDGRLAYVLIKSHDGTAFDGLMVLDGKQETLRMLRPN
jgi:hypothetical protein